MLDFTPVRNKQITMNDLAEGLTLGDLRSLTNEMVDHVLNLIKDCTDADVTFEPQDPVADDKAAATSAEVRPMIPLPTTAIFLGLSDRAFCTCISAEPQERHQPLP